MPSVRPVVYVVGLMLCVLGLAMLIPMAVDLAAGNADWPSFLGGSLITLFAGGLMIAGAGRPDGALRRRQAFLLTASVWCALPVFGALPFLFAHADLDLTDTIFEAVSGITTTGATVMVGLDNEAPGILLWRSILHWIGGIGVIVMAIAILPLLQVGGMQLFHTESSDLSEKAFPRARQIAAGITRVYLVLTVVIAVALWLCGMTPFEAINHAMATISTGGFSTRDASIGGFNSAAIEWVTIVGMLAGGVTFMLYLRLVAGDWACFLRDTQTRMMMAVILAAVSVIVVMRVIQTDADALGSIRPALFNVVSIITTTGFVTQDYGLWGAFAPTIFFVLTFLGACAGSTSGGFKMFRLAILLRFATILLNRAISPHRVVVVRYAGRTLEDSVALAVLGFVGLWIAVWAVMALGLGLTGMDFIAATSSAATALANVGPGLGPQVGPAGNFAGVGDAAKWIMIIGMLLGRLELVTILVLFMPAFWRN